MKELKLTSVMNKNIVSSVFNDGEILEIIAAFKSSNELIGDGKRNVIKNVNFKNQKLTVKSFKKPHLINSVVYRFLRKSKAERSFRYAKILTSKGIGTPKPIGYVECFNYWRLTKSYYVSEYVDCDLTFREINKDFKSFKSKKILRAFTKFTFRVHENDILFHDNSPGNTLIKKTGKSYEFYLVDLNRMSFKKLTLHDRINNFSRLTSKKKIIKIMSKEYAKLTDNDKTNIFEIMNMSIRKFQHKFVTKKKIKRKLKFWKK